MKKLHVLIYTTFLVLAIFSCKQKKSIVDYVNKGFAKPIMEADARFTVFSIGDENKLYVPSEKDIEVQFSIKNKYNQELAGEIQMPQDKKVLFNKEPQIIELASTKMVIEFNFKAEAEPQAINNFLGESVGMTVKIFEKETGRFLSSQSFIAGCNTPPPAITKDKLVYKEDTDEYIVTLPTGAGVHQDLREVRFTLYSDFGNEVVEPKILSVIDAGEQGKQYTPKVKGPEGWQLKNASGQRNIKAIVYDRAGLKSSEENQPTNRYFTSINLLPSNKDISFKRAKEKGVPVPKIEELEDFFKGDSWQNLPGYAVEYSDSTPAGFTYDPNDKMLKNASIVAGTSYTVKVTLKQGSVYTTDVFAYYTINIVGDNVAAIDTDSFAITDITEYTN